ncbi:hypothetical protein FRC12_024929 [Ceratobasidium sp. 428]|nr:hypothetical protein FRC12_024929 [Ceratobasidium sp. 428]
MSLVSHLYFGVSLADSSLVGATLSSVILLPGTYSSSSPVASILPPLGLITPTAESGITVSPAALSYPITVSLPAGALAYSTAFYAGSATPVDLSSNLTSPRLPGSLAIPPNMAVTFRSPSSSSSLVLFSSIPDTAQLPTLAADFSFSAVQATACAPACASGGACTANGACVCAPGFTGDQCEQCLPGHFGPSCQQCADQCCDDGMSGSGRCLGARSKNSVETCACEKGTCASDGSCTCNPGWTNPSAGNSTKCSICAPGFFLDPAGECQVCSQGCTSCAATTGVCTTCQTSFTPDTNDRTRCIPTPASSTTTCTDGQFLDTTTGACTACSPLCKTCTGPLSTQCVACGAGQFMGLGGRCVAVDSGGVCQGTKLVANNAKGICDACPSTCTTCSIPSFSVVSTTAQIRCSACLPGFVLTPQGKCASTCPAGTFVSPSDGFTCTACDSSCAECAGSAAFCTACATGGALDGKCVGTCPGGTFLSQSTTPPSSNSTVKGNTCLTCHPDCASCTGASNTQCASCPSTRPVKSQDGRCLPASSCGAQSYFDTASGTCTRCDGTCASCVGGGGGMCSACPEGNVLKAGRCVVSECPGGGSMAFGVCLSSLVVALPARSRPGGNALQIALGATGGLSLIVLGLLVWRRRARSRRAKETAAFADTLPDTKNKRWEWGRVWRMGEAQRKREQGLFGGLGLGGKRRKEFHREMSLKRLNSGVGNSGARWRARRTANMSVDRDWRPSDAESSVVFNREVPLPPFSDRDSIDSRREDFWRDSVDRSGPFGGINPESHFTRTLAAARASLESRKQTPTPAVAASVQSITPQVTGAKTITPNITGNISVTPDVTGVSAHTFGSPSPLVNLSDSSSMQIHQTGTSVAHSTQSSMDYMHNGGAWMVPDLTGMSSVPSHHTGSVGVHNTGTSTTTSLASHYTGMSLAPRAPLPYAPFLSASTTTLNTGIPQPRQPLRDNTAQGFTINTTLAAPRQNTTNMLMTPPPHAIPSSPVWPGAVGGSYWFSEEQHQQAQAQTKLGDKNPFRRF